MLRAAQLYQHGGSNLAPSWSEAVHWYDAAMHAARRASSPWGFALPEYEILGRIGHMLCGGDHGLGTDLPRAHTVYTRAAELAIGAMKMKTAMKYSALAEECGV